MNKKRLHTAICFIFLFFLSLSFAYGQQIEIRILHVNDFHGFAEPYKPLGTDELLGGVAYLSAKANEFRKGKPSLFLSAGDMIQGNNWANLFQGKSVIEWMNAMRFDAMVLGNHEFDFGKGALKKRISEARFSVLGANVEGLERLRPYIMKEIGGIKVAVIGVVTEDILATTHPRNVVRLKFFSPIDTVEKYVKKLKGHAEMVIVLSHVGHHIDRIIAERVKGIDVIVGGHSHTKLTKPVEVGNTIIVQAWEHGKALGVLDLTIKDRKIIGYEGHLEEIRPEQDKEDKRVLNIVTKYKHKVDALFTEKVGEAEVDLDGENVRKGGTNLGNLVADIMREVSGADVTIINGGGIRASIKTGEIRVKDVYTALPFDNYIVAIKLTGRQIWEALEYGVSGVEEEEGRFPQVSGIISRYFPSERRGSRIKEIFIKGNPVDLEKEYIVATNDFLAVGGDGYKVFAETIKISKDYSIIGDAMKGEKVAYSNSGRWVRDVVVEYIKEKKRIAPIMEGRIIEIR
jgi:2',3'-cyclic-nucleotide 2'-phosphodiesterase (5'-nucleotidase family)